MAARAACSRATMAAASGSVRDVGGREHAVDQEKLLRQADRGEFGVGTRGLHQGGGLRPGHQHQPGAQGVGQGIDGRLVLRTLLFQPGQRPQAGGVAFAFFQKTAPGAGQLQHADGVAGGRGVEDDVGIGLRQRGIGQQAGEFVKGGDLGGAGARELFLDASDHVIRQQPAHRSDDAVAVGLRGGLRVDLQRGQPGHGGHRRDVVADGDAEHLPDVRCRVGADQKHALSPRREFDGGGAGDRGLANAALAGEEQEARRLLQKFHGVHCDTDTGTAARDQQQRLPAQQLPAGATSAKAGAARQRRSAQRVSSARFG